MAEASDSVFSAAMDNSLQWAMGFPISDGHFALTFALVFLGGARVFQSTAATFNANRYGWGATGPTWLVGCLAAWVGMASALTSQPAFLVDSPRIFIAGYGVVLAVLIVGAPLAKFVMSISYGAAVSSWLTTLALALLVSTTSSMIGAGILNGSPKVLHWQGDVRVKDVDSNPWKKLSKDRKLLKEGGLIQSHDRSAAIVNVAGHRVLLMPGSQIRIAELGEEPRITIQRGKIFSRAGASANRKMRFETVNAGFKITGADVVVGVTRTGISSAVVAKGSIYAGRSIEARDMTTVKQGHYVVVTANVTPPARIAGEYIADLRVLKRYSENPFAPANRRMISGGNAPGERNEEKKSPNPKPPEKPAEKAPEKPATDAKPEIPAAAGDTNAAPATGESAAPAATNSAPLEAVPAN